MKLMSRAAIGMLAVGFLVTACGCSPQASALSKLQSGDIGSLSSAEWIALADLGAQVGIPLPELTIEQAEVLVVFLDINGVQTIDDLQQLINSGDIEVPPDVLELLYTMG